MCGLKSSFRNPTGLGYLLGIKNGFGLIFFLFTIMAEASTPIYRELQIENSYVDYPVWVILFSISIAVIFFLNASRYCEQLNSRIGISLSPKVLFGSILTLVFGVFVSLGITGSSIQMALQQTPFVSSDLTRIWGKTQSTRSDEWLVFTQMAIAQHNHTPPNPITNSNLGEDGQNMLIAGMTGVPVAHISALAKPATWGFFVFDLKRALSWYWCFPVFACLLALWAVILKLLPGQWEFSFLISLLFCASPYVVAWSYWPAYAVFFPSLCFLAAVGIIRAKTLGSSIAWSCALGLGIAGFALFLYPPWQIALAYLFLMLSIGYVFKEKLYKQLDFRSTLSFVGSISIAFLILWCWWLDARPAINTILATVYPGQRTAEVGGGLTWPLVLRGFSNLVSLHKSDHWLVNQSEVASFPYLLLPMIVLFFTRWRQRSIGPVEISLLIAISFFLYYMFFGFPADISKTAMMGRMTAHRADLALGLAFTLLCGLLLVPGDLNPPRTAERTYTAVFISAIWVVFVFLNVSKLHESILGDLIPSLVILLIVVTFMAGYWLIIGQSRNFIFLMVTMSLATTIPFHPIAIAPTKIESNLSFLSPASTPTMPRRILTLNSVVPAMSLLASGKPIVSGVFYYPQTSLWKRLDPNGEDISKYNRYQHLVFWGEETEVFGRSSVRSYRVDTPEAGSVKVSLDLERFDFRDAGAGYVASPAIQENGLRKNTSLKFIARRDSWSWFLVADAESTATPK